VELLAKLLLNLQQRCTSIQAGSGTSAVAALQPRTEDANQQ
jgi:hypothetical protein